MFLSSLLPPIDVSFNDSTLFISLTCAYQFHASLQADFRDSLMPIVVATSGDNVINAIFTSTSSQDVPAEERKQLLTLLPPLICSVCAAGTASSNTR